MQATIPFIPWILSWEWDFLTPMISPWLRRAHFLGQLTLRTPGNDSLCSMNFRPNRLKKMCDMILRVSNRAKKISFFIDQKRGHSNSRYYVFFHIKKILTPKNWVTFRKLQQTRPPKLLFQFNSTKIYECY